MGYFRDITTGQSLEDVDISVHCDITIFEWLMAWIKHQDKRDSMFSSEDEAKQLGKFKGIDRSIFSHHINRFLCSWNFLVTVI